MVRECGVIGDGNAPNQRDRRMDADIYRGHGDNHTAVQSVSTSILRQQGLTAGGMV